MTSKTANISGEARASWDDYFLRIATEVASRATCPRKHVGAVLVRDKAILCTGFNGSVRGQPHCDEVGCLMVENHCQRTIHAEINALAQAARNGVRIDGATAYVTALPCWGCAKTLFNAGVTRMVYGEAYRPDPMVLEVARALGVEMVGPGSKDVVTVQDDAEHHVIYWHPGRFTISVNGQPKPGTYETLTAARRAFQVTDAALDVLMQDRVKSNPFNNIEENQLPDHMGGPLAVTIEHGRRQDTRVFWVYGPPPELPFYGHRWSSGAKMWEASVMRYGKGAGAKYTGLLHIDGEHARALFPYEIEKVVRGESIAEIVFEHLGQK